MGKEQEQGQSRIGRVVEYYKDGFPFLPGSGYYIPNPEIPNNDREEIEQEIFSLSQESQDIENDKTTPKKEKEKKQDRHEPFVNPPEYDRENLFVNNYAGAYSQRIELNRDKVERALQTAHLEGKVFLSTLSPSRSRSEAQGNELAAKRFVIFEKKTQKAEEENPYKRVVSTPEGWNIQINDQRMVEELSERRLSLVEHQKVFIREFNSFVKSGIRESVWREKCSSEKDPYFRDKFMWSVLHGGVLPLPNIIINPSFTPVVLGVIFATYGLMNIFNELNYRKIRSIEEILKVVNSSFIPPSFSRHRNIDHPLEYFMPYVEIDKVARTYSYLAGKGRRLVREAEDK